jgi:two-component system NtrC family sensor kinase
MLFQSLKFKITANLAFIILLSVLLSDFVIITVIQKSLIQERVSQGRQSLSYLPDLLFDHLNSDTKLSDTKFEQIFHESGAIYLYIHLNSGLEYHFGNASIDFQNDILKLSGRSIKDNVTGIKFLGNTFGVFMHQKKYVLISEPIVATDSEFSGIKLIVLGFDDIFQTLRQSQKIIILYVIANFIILLLFSVYRLSRLIIRPSHRFIRMTDDFRVKDRLYFTHGKNFQEFNQLSKALNHMVDTIETDKESLQHSLEELKKTNDELKNAQHEIIRAEKLASVGRLSAGIAHEIGNPIGIVLGYLDLLKSRPVMKNDDVGQDFLKRAQDEINRINTVIRQLLDFSRSSFVDAKIVSMHDLVRDVVLMMSGQPLMSDVTIDYQFDDIVNTVNIDSDQIRQVLINLIINAADSIKSSENTNKGSIRIVSELIPAHEQSALNNQSTFVLKVIDNGTGISNDNIEFIFDPFFTTKEPGKGTGLGLSVSYMIIEQAGGRLIAKSEIVQGTTMMIHLPIYFES